MNITAGQMKQARVSQCVPIAFPGFCLLDNATGEHRPRIVFLFGGANSRSWAVERLPGILKGIAHNENAVRIKCGGI